MRPQQTGERNVTYRTDEREHGDNRADERIVGRRKDCPSALEE